MAKISHDRFRVAVEHLDQQRAAQLTAPTAATLDPQCRAELGEIRRRQGDLDAAAVCFEGLDKDTQPERAAYLAALLRQRVPAVKRKQDCVWPSPYTLHDEAFDPADAAEMLATAVGCEHEFGDATLSGARLDTTVRRALSMPVPTEWRGRFRAMVLNHLPAALRMFAIDPFEVSEIRSSLLCNRDGDFYLPHSDHGARAETRVISVIYYLHSHPKRFSGGHLLLHDGDVSAGEGGVLDGRFTRIEARHNRAVFFPSDVTHEVTRVAVADANFASNRFAVACWVCRAGATSAPR